MGGTSARPAGAPVALLLAGAGLALTWAYRPTLAALAGRWLSDAQASAGLIAPVFALCVLWLRRRRLPERGAVTPSWWGLAFVLLGGGLRLGAAVLSLDWFDGLSLLPTLFGLGLLGGGWPLGRWLLPGLAVLVFMLPLPYGLEIALSGPLQGFATRASTFALQTLGLPATAEGNIIAIGDTRIGVLEACNGLGMLTAFFALCAAAALALERPLWQRLALFASAVPVAVLVNLVRLTGTGYLTHVVGPLAGVRFHDLAGWGMMPLALLLVWLELLFLDRLFVDRPAVGPDPAGPAPLPRGSGSRPVVRLPADVTASETPS